MTKFNDIPRKKIFKVPEGYFENLPSRIQKRIETGEPVSRVQPVLRFGLQYALPLFLIAAILFFYLRPTEPDPETMLISVETAALVEYLQESGITTEEVLEGIEFSAEELDVIENESYDWNLPVSGDEVLQQELNSY